LSRHRCAQKDNSSMSSSCCKICVDTNCGGKQNCNCDACSRRDTCYRRAGIKPTIRITRKCTQTCGHCCFSCSPKITAGDMTLEMAEAINRFCRANEISRAEVMGGEFFVHGLWAEILEVLSGGLVQVRLVTNGDWAGSSKTASKVTDFLKAHPQFHVGVSKDQWHTNQHVDRAAELLQQAGIPFRIPTVEQTREESLVPAGRHQYEWSQFYGLFACYCSQPERRYNLLIDEQGEIYKCGFGSWPYASVNDFLQGGFAARFKEFNAKFYGAFISSCAACQRAESCGKKADANKETAA